MDRILNFDYVVLILNSFNVGLAEQPCISVTYGLIFDDLCYNFLRFCVHACEFSLYSFCTV